MPPSHHALAPKKTPLCWKHIHKNGVCFVHSHNAASIRRRRRRACRGGKYTNTLMAYMLLTHMHSRHHTNTTHTSTLLPKATTTAHWRTGGGVVWSVVSSLFHHHSNTRVHLPHSRFLGAHQLGNLWGRHSRVGRLFRDASKLEHRSDDCLWIEHAAALFIAWNWESGGDLKSEVWQWNSELRHSDGVRREREERRVCRFVVVSVIRLEQRYRFSRMEMLQDCVSFWLNCIP